MAWHTPRNGGRDQPSPILVGTHLIVTDMAGVATCYDSGTGKELWKDRLRGASHRRRSPPGGWSTSRTTRAKRMSWNPAPR